MGSRRDDGRASLGHREGFGVFTLEPLAGGTRTTFTWAESLDYPWYLGGRIGAAVSARLLLTPLWRRNLKRLQALVEAP